MNTIFIVLPILTLLMFQLGIELKLKDFSVVVKQPKAMVVGLIGQLIFLPILAFIWGKVFHLEAVFFVGLMLIACSPGGSSSNVFSMLAKGNLALSVSLTVFSSILTLFTIPVIMSFVVRSVGGSDVTGIELPVGSLIIQNVVLMLLPMLLGLLFRYKFPRRAEKTGLFIGKFAFPALLVLITVFFLQHYKTIFEYIERLGIVVLLLILSALFVAALLVYLARLRKREKRTIIIEVGIQNAAQAIAIASSPFVFGNDIIAIPAIIYSLLMNLILLPYVQIARKK